MEQGLKIGRLKCNILEQQHMTITMSDGRETAHPEQQVFTIRSSPFQGSPLLPFFAALQHHLDIIGKLGTNGRQQDPQRSVF